jgi:hypothetical protein
MRRNNREIRAPGATTEWDCLQLIPTSEKPMPSNSNPGVTRIEREHFLLHAPFQWKAIASENPLEFEFHNQTLPEQLIVTVMLAQTPFAQDELLPIAEEFAARRVEAYEQLSGGRAIASPVSIQSAAGQVEARSIGRDEPNNVRFAWAIRAAPAKVVTIALTRYTLDEIGTPFPAYAASILDFVQIKSPNGQR